MRHELMAQTSVSVASGIMHHKQIAHTACNKMSQQLEETINKTGNDCIGACRQSLNVSVHVICDVNVLHCMHFACCDVLPGAVIAASTKSIAF